MTKQRKKPEGDVEKYDAVIEAPDAAKATGTESVELLLAAHESGLVLLMASCRHEHQIGFVS